MVALPDVNVLVALFDADHIHHEAAHAWFARQLRRGWATCPITENGVVRILSSPNYPGRRTTLGDAVDRLRDLRTSGRHSFWPADVSLTDASLIRHVHVGGHRQITDTYLLALACRHSGTLATFDRSVILASVAAATPASLTVLGPARRG